MGVCFGKERGDGGATNLVKDRRDTAPDYTSSLTFCRVVGRCASSHRHVDYQLLVLGAGPAGVRAAAEASSRGVRVGLIDTKPAVTGAPTGAHSKCLRKAALDGCRTWEGVQEALDRTQRQAISNTSRQLQPVGVKIMTGRGELMNPKVLLFTPASGPPQALTFECLVIATGSVARRVPLVDFDLPGVYDADTIQGMQRIPQHLVVQGGGIIGLEYAVIYKLLGVESVIVVDHHENFAPPNLDCSLKEACMGVVEKNNIEFIRPASVSKVESGEGSTESKPEVLVTLADGRVLKCDCLLSCMGRLGATTGIGLEHLEGAGLKIMPPKRFIQVDANGATGVKSVYAVGDCAGNGYATVGQASATRSIRFEYGSGLITKETLCLVHPVAVWTVPEVAWAGVTEEQAAKDNIPCTSVVIDFRLTMRGCVSLEDQGFLKLLYDSETGRVLGVYLCGDGASDLVNFGAEAVRTHQTIYEISQLVFPAITYHELYHLAATEAKLRISCGGAKSLETAVAWRKVKKALEKASREEGTSVRRLLNAAFKYFDADSSGFISLEEAYHALKGLGMDLDAEQVHQMVIEASGSADKGINYQQFSRMLADDLQPVANK